MTPEAKQILKDLKTYSKVMQNNFYLHKLKQLEKQLKTQTK